MRPPIGPKKEETKAVYEAWMDMLIDWPEVLMGLIVSAIVWNLKKKCASLIVKAEMGSARKTERQYYV